MQCSLVYSARRRKGKASGACCFVGNVGINRIRANCSDFKGIRTIPQMINQPHAFEALPLVGRFKKHCFYQPTTEECDNIFNTF